MNSPLPEKHEEHSVGEVLSEMGTTTKNLISSELELARAELKRSVRHLTQHSVRAATFGALCAINAFPFLAFLIIGLGRLMNDNYWLSSLIVGLICVAVGGPLALAAIKKMKEEDFTLPLTRETLEEDRQVMNSNVHRIRSLQNTSATLNKTNSTNRSRT